MKSIRKDGIETEQNLKYCKASEVTPLALMTTAIWVIGTGSITLSKITWTSKNCHSTYFRGLLEFISPCTDSEN